MTVYVVVQICTDDCTYYSKEYIDVFATQKQADAWIKHRRRQDPAFKDDNYQVIPKTLDTD